MAAMRYVFGALSVIAAVIIACPVVTGVRAASGITVSPPLKDITLGPGLVETAADLTITNSTAQQVRAQLKVVDLKALGEFGGTSLDKAGLPDSYGLANWMTLPGGDTVIIPAGKTVKVPVTIMNKADLSPGGHYGAVIVTTDSNESVKSNVNISQQLVSLVFVKKLGGEKYGLDLKGMSLNQSKGRIPESVALNFASTGNVHIIPRGYLEITDPKGRLISKAIINPDSSLVLPGSARQFVALMQPVDSSSLSGQYKVTAYYRYDEQTEFMSQSLYFTHTGTSRQLLAMVAIAAIALLTTCAVYFWKRLRKSGQQKK